MDATTDPNAVPVEAHEHLDALLRLLGVRIERGSVQFHFDQFRAQSVQVTTHQRIKPKNRLTTNRG